jgi:hypothetical protein
VIEISDAISQDTIVGLSGSKRDSPKHRATRYCRTYLA